MKVKRLGRTGLKVTEVCLGTMTFGHQCDKETSFAILNTAAEAGVTFIDTADVYPIPVSLETAGRTEEIFGEWLRGRREEFCACNQMQNADGSYIGNRRRDKP